METGRLREDIFQGWNGFESGLLECSPAVGLELYRFCCGVGSLDLAKKDTEICSCWDFIQLSPSGLTSELIFGIDAS